MSNDPSRTPSNFGRYALILGAGLCGLVCLLGGVLFIGALILGPSIGGLGPNREYTLVAQTHATSTALALDRAMGTIQAQQATLDAFGIQQTTGAQLRITSTPTPWPTTTPESGVPDDVRPGELAMEYPGELVVGAGDVVVLEIRAERLVASVGAPPALEGQVVDIELTQGDAPRLAVEASIRLYPVMSAELSAAGEVIQISEEEYNRRYLYERDTAAWTWDIVALEPGRHKVTLRVYGEAEMSGEATPVLVKSITRNIQVRDRPLGERLLDWMGDNILVILGAGGPIALLLMYLSIRASRDRRGPGDGGLSLLPGDE